MRDNLLEQLLGAQSPEEEIKILLNSLPKAVSEAAWVAAIPHWFNAEIIAALLPELASQANELYEQLQEQSFVELFQDRGHNIHELTRKRILSLWWGERQAEYRKISKRAERYFSSQIEDISLIESAYHYLISPTYNTARTNSQWSEIASRLKISGRYALAHTLIQNAREHIINGRVPEAMEKLLIEWERAFAGELQSIGEERTKDRDLSSATEIFSHAQKLFADLKDKKAEANILMRLSTMYLQQERSDTGIEQLENALEMYREQADIPGSVKAYIERGKIYKKMEQYEPALSDFNRAIELNTESTKAYAHRGVVHGLLDQYEAALNDFNRAIELNPNYAWALANRGITYGRTE